VRTKAPPALRLAGRTAARVDVELLAGWALLVSRLTGESRVAIYDVEASSVVDLLIDGEQPWAAWVTAVSVARSTARATRPAGAGDAECAWGSGSAPASCALRIAFDPGRFELAAHFDPQRMDASTVQRLLGLLGTVIEHRDSQRPIGTIDLIDSAARAALQRWSHGEWPYEGPHALAAAFAEQVARRPQATALAFAGSELTYERLDRASDALAAALRETGLQAGNVIALEARRSAAAIVAVLAVVKMRAAYLPIDPDFPQDRVDFMLADSGCTMALVLSDAFRTAPAVRRVQIDLQDILRPPDGTAPPRDDASGDELAYVMYTSGSTGLPKGVEIPQRAIVRLVKAARFMRLDENVRMLHAAPLGFDASTLEIWGPLLNGGVCVVHEEPIPSAHGLGETIRSQRANAAWLTAALFNAVVDDDVEQLRGLSELLIGGETLSVPHVA
jgi:non-ribosomal peptide synthetase component F